MATEKPTALVLDNNGALLAIVTRSASYGEGVHFVTPNDLQQQVAVMKRSTGDVIPAHRHLPVPRSLRGTQEVLIILRGALQADIYDSEANLITSVILKSGDVITLVSGGHGFSVLEEAEFIEVKQGPYVPGKDKIVFSAKANSN